MNSQSKSAENPQPDHNRFIATGKCSSRRCPTAASAARAEPPVPAAALVLAPVSPPAAGFVVPAQWLGGRAEPARRAQTWLPVRRLLLMAPPEWPPGACAPPVFRPCASPPAAVAAWGRPWRRPARQQDTRQAPTHSRGCWCSARAGSSRASPPRDLSPVPAALYDSPPRCNRWRKAAPRGLPALKFSPRDTPCGGVEAGA